MRSIVPAAVALALSLSIPPVTSAGPLRMEFKDGYVTISATDVPLRQLLTEWARLGHTRIVNVEKVGGSPLTLELQNVPEKLALETVLRTVPGYMVAQRDVPVPGGSQFDRIVVMPGVVAPPSRAAALPPSHPQQVPPPQQMPQPQQVPPQQPAFPVDDQDQPLQEVPEQPVPDSDDAPPVMHQPGIMPMPPAQGQEKEGQPPGPAPVPYRGMVSSPRPGTLPVQQPQKPPEQ